MDLVTLFVTAVLALLAGLAAGIVLGTGVLRRERTSAADQVSANLHATASAVQPVKESLDRFDTRLREMETTGVAWQERLAAQVEAVRSTGESLRRETSSLATALRRPHVRGQWGEMQLRRAVELAGMVERCDFTMQTSVRTADGVQRPDLLVRLAGNRQVVVDAKVPLDAFLQATDAAGDGDTDTQARQLAQHARQVRSHVDSLAAKAYWRQFAPAPEFVVMFVPGEAFWSYALEADPGLVEYAAARRVVPATPTTLIALLRTVAYAWTQESVAEGAREVQQVAHELYDRLGTLGGHVDKLGRSLTTAVTAYNGTVGALEGRVLVSARRLHEMGVGEQPHDPPRAVDEAVRQLVADELVADELVADELVARDAASANAARRAG